MEKSMSEKRVALVTGGMGGIGEVVCCKLAQMGYQVVTTYSRKNGSADEWLTSMRGQGFEFAAMSPITMIAPPALRR
jgi:acetoacetyl-CoA reductase